MPLKASLRRSLERSSPSRVERRYRAGRLTAAGMAILCICMAEMSYAQEVQLDAQLVGGRLEVSSRLIYDEFDEVVAFTKNGLETQIVFQFRLYVKNRGLFSFLGDRLVVERKISRTLRWDIFKEKFIIQTSENDVTEAGNEIELSQRFFAVSQYDLGQLENDDSAPGYLMARIRLIPFKIIKPLRFLPLFSVPRGFTSAWVRLEVR